jgi:trans-aconitate 2-methyltransferase
MSTAQPTWDPAQYGRFERERAQPFFDLLARVPGGAVRRAADLGCGTGALTCTLAERWPDAVVWGVDSSAEMLRQAGAHAAPARLRFVQADLASWEPEAPLDRIVSNAALQWVPDHARVLASLAARLAPGGVLAVQMPNNDDEPSHRILAELSGEAPWRDALCGASPRSRLEPPAWYADRLIELGLEVELWQTIYHHRLARPSEVVEWVKGSALRPVLSRLDARGAEAFLAAYTARIERAHPAGAHGVLFPFPRLFFVAARHA